MVALLLEVAFAVCAIGLRSWVHWRQTGDSPFRGRSGIGGVTAMFGLGALLLLAPVLDLTGALPRLVHAPSVTALGVVVAGLGILATVWAQFAMGASWRIGVDDTERTALVTGGPFRWVRNPIYTSMLLFSLGIALVVPNLASLLSFAIVVAMLEYHVRRIEEPYLEEAHGAEYRRYAAHAGRFLPGVGRWLAIALVTSVVLGVPVARGASASQFVLSPEGNHLWAYEVASGQSQLVVRAVNGGDPGDRPPAASDRRDINGQVCVTPDRQHVITGEDTVLNGGGGEGSHDPRIAGWAYLRIRGSRLGAITVKQAGKLAPNAGAGPGYRGDPDNYGCGFLDSRRLLTTAIGNTLPGESANGQLLLWFAPFAAGYHRTKLRDGTSFYVGRVPHCEIDGTLATAGGIAVDRNGDVYLAANRPDGNGAPGAIWRYRGRWPRSPQECTPAFVAANIHREQVIPSVPGAPADARATTPSAVVLTPAHTLYVSSVFTGIVSEFSTSGQWMGDVYPAAPVAPPTGPTGRTPYGLAVTMDGSLWIANLGIVVDQPAPNAGSVLRVRFANGQPTPVGDTMKSNLNFPDGLGVYNPR